jgi:CheY-like chemotaxis protein
MSGATPSVLLIEDDEAIRSSVAGALRDEGWSVSVAGDGIQGLERLHADAMPTAIVLDLMMPCMNGQEFMEALRKDPACSGIPVIQISAGLNTAIPGVAARLDKPFRIERLLHLLATFARIESATREV